MYGIIDKMNFGNRKTSDVLKLSVGYNNKNNNNNNNYYYYY